MTPQQIEELKTQLDSLKFTVEEMKTQINEFDDSIESIEQILSGKPRGEQLF